MSAMFLRALMMTGTLIAAGTAPAAAQLLRTFVSTSGSDSNPCSLALPCRNFGAAISAVVPGGEVVALDSGGYGSVLITRPVSLIGIRGAHVAIAPTAGPAILIDVGPFDRVVLRGLFLSSQGADRGIDFFGGVLSVERTTIARFTLGIGQRSGTLVVADSLFSGNQVGVWAAPQTTSDNLLASLTRIRFENSGFAGLQVNGGSTAACIECVASGASLGYIAEASNARNAILTLERSVSTHNIIGIQANSMSLNGGGNAVVRVSNSVITHNDLGLDTNNDTSCAPCAQIISRVNNTVENAAANGFTGTFAPK